jgi:hypothetical protein
VKDLKDTTVCVWDSGTFIPLADMFGRVAKRTIYYSPFEQEYIELSRCIVGNGMANFERCDEPLDPKNLKEIDLFIFPDIGFGGIQRLLRSMGKLVFGSMGASDLELFRTRFIKVVKEVGLPVVPSVTIRGLTSLSDHLKTVKRKWIKINRYRDNAETWFHIDYKHSERELERQAYEFGPFKEQIVYVVQDEIADEGDMKVLEVGYDGWSIDGKYPSASYQGYEKKNELYLGSLLQASELPEEVSLVNEAFSPVLAEYGYRNFWATEIRIKDGVPHFIDPTARMAGQTMEHLLETCTNLPEVILAGAAGELITPEFSHPYSAEATLHYQAANEGANYMTFVLPDEIKDKVKLYQCAYVDGAYQFPAKKNDELGVIIGQGDSIEDAIADLEEAFEALKDEPVSIDSDGFADLLEQITTAQDEGVHFTDGEVPAPESVLS